MAFFENGNDTPGLVNVTNNFQAEVHQSMEPDKIGGAVMAALVDDGAITRVKEIRFPDVSLDNRLSTSSANLLDKELFNNGAQVTAKLNQVLVTQTIAFSSGFMNLNSSAIVTANTGSIAQSRIPVSIAQEGRLTYEMYIQLSAVGATNTELFAGRMIPNTGAGSIPLDGVYAKITSAGIFLVTNNNGTENEVAPLDQIAFDINKTYVIKIVENNRRADLYIDGVLYCSAKSPEGNASLTSSASGFISFQHRITAVAASAATIFKIGGYVCWSSIPNGYDILTSKAIQNVNGRNIVGSGTNGSIAKYVNNTNPAAAVPTNTTAALGTGLGGDFWETDTLAPNTDGIICSYQNPATSITVSGKIIMIHGIWIESVVQTALTGGGYTAIWTIQVGHTAVGLTTGDASNTKSPARVVLGTQVVGSGLAVNTKVDRIYVSFKRGFPVYPGEFVAVAKKKVGTAPTAGIFIHAIGIDYTPID